jgi:MoaA/NifB/PqqE/SkfB family radical SAM enzyme
MSNFFRFRIITNFTCNQRCEFCFQPSKGERVLGLDSLVGVLSKCPDLSRATIMGGESTLLDDLPEYILAAKKKADTVCLVTNGTLLTPEKVASYVRSGLGEIAVSVSSMEAYLRVRDRLMMAKTFVYNPRINIPKSPDSVGEKLRKIIDVAFDDGVGVVVCEDLMGRYGTYDFYYADLARTDGHNFLTYSYRGREFGLFAHYEGYDKTDIIITPIGNFASWEKYCLAIGNGDLK